MTGGAGADVFTFANGDSSSVAGAFDQIADFTVGVDDLSVGVTPTAGNFLSGTSATDYAQALSDATALIGSGSRDIVVINVAAGADAGTYVFADSGSTNSVGNAIKLTGSLTLTAADFI